jgi:nucleotide-binding universal stress UspA family protein
MRGVLVPLDGTLLAASILPDARRLAGPAGSLVLVRDITSRSNDPFGLDDLEAQADDLRADGVTVQVEALVTFDVALAIDEAATVFGADMIACATHARGPLGRLVRGGVAWRAVAHSRVPVLLRHPDETALTTPAERRILVPLDGSEYAEKGLSLARELAAEWGASIWLARVIPQLDASARVSTGFPITSNELHAEVRSTTAYLESIAAEIPGAVHAHVLLGGVIQALNESVSRWGITDIVMASHGRTGLPRVILGSVADGLLRQVQVPVIVIPSLAAAKIEVEHQAARTTEAQVPAGAAV